MTSDSATYDLSGLDLVKALLARLPEDEISCRTPLLHSALFELCKRPEFRRSLGPDYVFDEKGYFPFCREFDIDLLNLEQSGYLASPNPDFHKYTLSTKLRTSFRETTEQHLSPEALAKLDEMSKAFFDDGQGLTTQDSGVST